MNYQEKRLKIKPRISILLFVQNDESTISQALDSILGQTLYEIEVIIVNKESCDTTFSQCAAYAETDSRISLISARTTSLNRLLMLTHGDYIIVTDSGKYFERNAFEILYHKSQKTGADFTFSNYLSLDGKKAISESYRFVNSTFSWRDNPRKILNLSSFALENKLYKRRFFQKLLKTAKEYNILDIIDLSALGFIMANKILYVQEVLIKVLKKEVNRNSFKWENSIASILGFEYFLNKERVYPMIEQSFLNYTLERLLLLTDIFEPHRSIVEKYLASEITPYFDFLSHSEDYYFNIPLLRKYKNIIERKTISTNFELFYSQKFDKIIPIVITAKNVSEMDKVPVVIQSIKEHQSANYFYDLYVLSESDYKKEELEYLTNNNLRITHINITEKLPINLRKKEIGGLYIGLIPQIFWGYSRILYLSPDTLVQTDLSIFAEIDLKNYAAAGTLEYSDVNCTEKKTNLIPDIYISAEVLWLNLNECDEYNFTTPFFNEIVKDYKKPFQDTINIIFKNKLLILPPKYNAQVNLIYQKNNMDYYPWEESDFFILNYDTTHPLEKIDAPLSNIWWEYARRSCFYEDLLLTIFARKN